MFVSLVIELKNHCYNMLSGASASALSENVCMFFQHYYIIQPVDH